MDQAVGVAGGGDGVPHELAYRLPGGREGGGLGPDTPEFGRDPGAGDRRDAIWAGPPVPDGGVPDRRLEPAVVMARREADGGGQSAQGEVSVVLGVQVAVVSGAFSGCIVREDDAFADQTDETSGADDTESPGVDWKLVPGAKALSSGGGSG